MKRLFNRDNLVLVWMFSAFVSIIPALSLASDQMATVNPAYRILSIPFFGLFSSPFIIIIYLSFKDWIAKHQQQQQEKKE